ncbi:MAG: outer membrane beta-barrel protein [Terracidiphilus sp.]|jgi:hypothetical protein
MKSFHSLVQAWNGELGLRAGFFPVALLAIWLGMGLAAHSQAVPAADAGGMRMSAGGTVSGYELGYGQVKVVGATAFVDFDTLRHFGIEGEARWGDFHLSSGQNGPGADETASTYMGGLRYSRYYGRFQPYAKALVGIGRFNYPYNYASETDLVVAPGGGVDFRLTRRVRWRVVDFEYQLWPQFNFGQMTSVGVSSGLRVKIF